LKKEKKRAKKEQERLEQSNLESQQIEEIANDNPEDQPQEQEDNVVEDENGGNVNNEEEDVNEENITENSNEPETDSKKAPENTGDRPALRKMNSFIEFKFKVVDIALKKEEERVVNFEKASDITVAKLRNQLGMGSGDTLEVRVDSKYVGVKKDKDLNFLGNGSVLKITRKGTLRKKK